MKLGFTLGCLALVLSGCMTQGERTALLNGPYPLDVNNSRSVEESLGAGKYNHVSSDITAANFPSRESGQEKITAVLVPFSPQASLDSVLGRQAAAGFRPATLNELLAFGEAYPEVQKKLPVIALGSSADLVVMVYYPDSHSDMKIFPMPMRYDYRVMREYPFLGDGLSGRIVSLDWLDNPEGYSMYYACFVKAG